MEDLAKARKGPIPCRSTVLDLIACDDGIRLVVGCYESKEKIKEEIIKQVPQYCNEFQPKGNRFNPDELKLRNGYAVSPSFLG